MVSRAKLRPRLRRRSLRDTRRCPAPEPGNASRSSARSPGAPGSSAADTTRVAADHRSVEAEFCESSAAPLSLRYLSRASLVTASMFSHCSVALTSVRNRWDTVGFIPWYLTRLVAAPVISLAALGLLFQVSFTTDLTTATAVTALGLRGASPFTIFSVAIISGLFSNKLYDWLRGMLTSAAAPRPSRPGTVPDNSTTKLQGEEAQ